MPQFGVFPWALIPPCRLRHHTDCCVIMSDPAPPPAGAVPVLHVKSEAIKVAVLEALKADPAAGATEGHPAPASGLVAAAANGYLPVPALAKVWASAANALTMATPIIKALKDLVGAQLKAEAGKVSPATLVEFAEGLVAQGLMPVVDPTAGPGTVITDYRATAPVPADGARGRTPGAKRLKASHGDLVAALGTEAGAGGGGSGGAGGGVGVAKPLAAEAACADASGAGGGDAPVASGAPATPAASRGDEDDVVSVWLMAGCQGGAPSGGCVCVHASRDGCVGETAKGVPHPSLEQGGVLGAGGGYGLP